MLSFYSTSLKDIYCLFRLVIHPIHSSISTKDAGNALANFNNINIAIDIIDKTTRHVLSCIAKLFRQCNNK